MHQLGGGLYLSDLWLQACQNSLPLLWSPPLAQTWRICPLDKNYRGLGFAYARL